MNGGYTMVCVLALALAGVARAGDSAAGRALYETRCTGCHATSVHARATRVAGSCAAVRRQVERWNANLGGTWSAEEIDDVVLWLNERYYRYPAENGRCVVPTAAMAPKSPG